MIDRLDEERIEILRSWGIGLASDDREELRAAGKAITVLIEEIDRLHIDLWNTRVAERDSIEPEPEPLEERAPELDSPNYQALQRDKRMATTQSGGLRDRIARIRPHT